MVNQKTFESLYHYYFDEEIKTDDQSEEELYHHGVLGQSWGKKHGPPYPLGGIDKKIARAEARKKKERERKLKKMQRAAKKARREKKREEKREADILKKKQKLMKSGDMDQIRKNAKLFTNEELAYIMDREQLKKGLKGKDERNTDEKMELFMKRMGQIASIASSAQQVLGAAKVGMDVMQSYKATKVKELEADEKRMKALREEFEMRFQGDERSSSEAKRFLDDRINDRNYKPSKEKAPKESKAEKEERKTDEAIRVAQAREGREALKEYEKSKKRSKKEERQALKDEKKAEKEALKGGHKGMTWIKDGGNTFSTSDSNVRQFDVGSKFAQSKPVMESVYTPSSPSISSGVENLRAKGMLVDRTKYRSGFRTSVREAVSSSDATTGKNYVYDVASRTKWSSKPIASVLNSSSANAGRKYVFNTSSRTKWSSPSSLPDYYYDNGVKKYFSDSKKDVNTSDSDPFYKGRYTYDTFGRTKWRSSPASSVVSSSESKNGKTYVLSDRTKWATKKSVVASKTDDYVKKQMDDFLKSLNEQRRDPWTQSSKQPSKYKPKRAKYTQGRSKAQMEELRSIASSLRTYDHEQSRIGYKAVIPKFAAQKYENLSPADKAIVDRLRGNF